MPSRTQALTDLSETDYPGSGRFVWNVASGGLEWSPGLLDIYGRSAAPASEAEVLACLHPDDRLRVEGETASFLTGDANDYSHSFRILRPDGEVRYLLVRGLIARDDDGLVTEIRGLGMDVTDFPHVTHATMDTQSKVAEVTSDPRSYSSHDLLEVGQQTSGLVLVDIDYRADTHSLSAEAARLYGLGESAVTVPRARLHDTFHPEDKDELLAKIAQALDPDSGGSLVAEHRVVLPDGEVRWLQVQKRIDFEERDGQRQPDRGILAAIDITALKLAEANLKESENRLALAQEVVGIGVWDGDFRSGEMFWTDQLYDLMDINPAAPATPETFFAKIHSDDVGRVRKEFETAIAQRTLFNCEFRVVRSDGEIRDIKGQGRVTDEEDGQPNRVTGVNYDITDRKRAERQLQQNSERLRMILDETVAMVGIVDLDGTLIEANRVALVAGGLDRDAVIGRPFWDAPWWTHDPEEVSRVKQAIATAIAGDVVRYDARIRAGSGELLTVDFSLSPVRNDKGDVILLVPSALDITERKRHEEHVGLLLKEVNHRSKNMLALIDVIAKRTIAKGHEGFATRFSDRLRALSTNQDVLVRSDWKEVDLICLMRGQMSHFADMFDTRVHFEGDPLSIRPEAAEKLGMAIHELATNASKYGALSDTTGEVCIQWTVERRDGEPFFILDWQETGGPLVSAPTQKGFGSMVSGSILASGLDGTVDTNYHSTGLVWRLECPLPSMTSVQVPVEEMASAPSATTASASVLVVDDDPFLGLSIKEMLEDAEHEVLGPARSADSALALIAETQPGFAILDVNLGNGTSEPVALELRRLGVPFLCVSGYSRDQLPKAYDGAPFLSKPVSEPDVLHILHEETAEYRARH